MVVTSCAAPTYDLKAFQAEVKAQRYRVTHSALEGAMAMGLDASDIEECVLNLDPRDFYKTMPASSKLGHMQDVYKPTYEGHAVYLKLQHDSTAFIISFKEDESK